MLQRNFKSSKQGACLWLVSFLVVGEGIACSKAAQRPDRTPIALTDSGRRYPITPEQLEEAVVANQIFPAEYVPNGAWISARCRVRERDSELNSHGTGFLSLERLSRVTDGALINSGLVWVRLRAQSSRMDQCVHALRGPGSRTVFFVMKFRVDMHGSFHESSWRAEPAASEIHRCILDAATGLQFPQSEESEVEFVLNGIYCDK
jgi:hypothetical protein